MILSQHDAQCATCVRSGNCTLQTIANDLNVVESPYKKEICVEEWDTRYPLVRDASKCVKCMRCIQVCDKIQGMHIWDVSGTGARTTVGVLETEILKQQIVRYADSVLHIAQQEHYVNEMIRTNYIIH